MDIDYYRRYEPIFNSWYITKMIGEGSFGQVFEIEKTELGNTYKAALKIITVPQKESEIKSVMSDGMSKEEVTAYYKGIVQDIVSESILMSRLKGNSNIVSYEDHMVIEHEDNIGWDILIKMELLTPLLDHLAENSISTYDVIKLGIDVCKALELCEKNNIIHRDVKPENIFISPNGDYKLGDFGIAKTVEKTISGMSRKGTYTYMAPEIYKGELYGSSVDIYSLGIVMYRLLNGNRAPFLPAAPTPLTYQMREHALMERIHGKIIAAPQYSEKPLTDIVLKACAYNVSERYSSAKLMRHDLEKVLKTTKDVFLGTKHETIDAEKTPELVKENNDKGELIKKTSEKAIPNKNVMLKIGIPVVVIIVGILIFLISLGNQEKDALKTEQTMTVSEEERIEQPEEIIVSDATELQSAIDNAKEGTIIYIESGNYHFDQPLEINQNNISLLGRGDTKPQIDCGIFIYGSSITIDNINVNITGSSLPVEKTHAMRVEGSGVTISNTDIEVVYSAEYILYGLDVFYAAEIDNCTIYVDNLANNGAVAIGTSVKFTMTNSSVTSDDIGIYSFVEDDEISDAYFNNIISNNSFNVQTYIWRNSDFPNYSEEQGFY